MTLYKECEKRGGKRARCKSYPNCLCDWYDRPSRTVNGRTHRPWVHLPNTARNKQAAIELAMALRLEYTKREAGLLPKEKQAMPLLSEYITLYTGTDNVEQCKTAKKIGANLAGFLAHVKDRPLNEVTGSMIETWRKDLLKNKSKMTGGTLSRNTIQRMYNSVKGMFTYAAEQIEDFNSPCWKLKDWKVDAAPRRLWTTDEQWLIDELDDRFRLPLTVGSKTSCRRSEVLVLTKHDISPKGWHSIAIDPRSGREVTLGWIRLQRKKRGGGHHPDRVPIDLGIVEELRKQLKNPFQLHIFGDPPPNPGSWSSLLTREIRRLGEQYGIDTKGLCMHGTRHNSTTTMQDMPGVSTQTAKVMGGWTTTRMVETYSSPVDASMQAAAAGLAAQWNPERPKGLTKRLPDKPRRTRKTVSALNAGTHEAATVFGDATGDAEPIRTASERSDRRRKIAR